MFTDLVSRLRSLIRRTAVEGELDEELRFHLENQVVKYIQSGLTREQAVDRVLATARTESFTPMPAWVLEPIPTRDERKAWTQDQRQAEGRTRGQRYEELRAWWVREMLTTPSPLTERMTLFWHNHFTSGQDKVGYPQQMAQQG